MKPRMLAGVLLVVLGVLALAYQGFSYTREKKVIDLGPLQATTKTTEHVPLPPIVGALALVGGAVLICSGSKQG
jgi:drug/metabolite transporter (DMT)-like permease